MAEQIEDGLHKTCVDCGKFGELNTDITYRGTEYICWTCHEIYAWEKWGRTELFSTTFSQYVMDGNNAEASTKKAREIVAKEDKRIAALKRNRGK